MTTIAGSVLTPWRQIWLHPRATIRELLSAPPRAAMWVFPIASGIGQSMLQGASNSMGAKVPLWAILSMSALVGTIWGLLQLHVLAGVMFLADRFTGGTTTFRQARLVIAWAEVPHTVLVATWWAAALVLGRLVFVDIELLGANPPPGLILGMLLVYLVSLICVGWSFVILVQGFAEAQSGSAWKALGTLLVAGLSLGVAAVVVAMFVMGLAR